jgi:ligand-binding sensor domain-containing protein
MWIAPTGLGLIEFDGTNCIVYDTTNSGLPSNYILPRVIDSGGTKWIGTGAWALGEMNRRYDAGLVAFDGSEWTVYDTLNSRLPDNGVSAIAIDKDGTKWIGTDYGGLAAFDGISWTVYDTLNSELPSNSISSLVIDNDGTKWIGTWIGALAAFNENGIPTRIQSLENTPLELKVYPNPVFDLLTLETQHRGRSFITISSPSFRVSKS